MVNLTRNLPKALVKLNNRPLIDYALTFAENLSCNDIIVVGGFYFDKLERFIEQSPYKVTLLGNTDFLKGNIFTFIKTLPYLDEDFLLLNVDHIYPLRMGRAFIKQKEHYSNITAFVDFDRPLYEDDMKVRMRDSQTISQISKGLTEFDAGYIGGTYVPAAKIDLYKQTAQEIAEQNESAVVENILQQCINRGDDVNIFSATGIRWLEIDNFNDLKNAERILKWVRHFLD